MFQRNVPGMLIAPLPAAVGHLRLEWENFSAVAIGYSLARPQLHRVTTDRYQAMRLAVRELRHRNYRRLGLALDANQDARVHHQWVAAFLWEQMHSRPADRVPLLVVKDRQWSERRFAEWFKQTKPEVVLGYDPRIAAWLEHLGCSLPRDVGFVHLWNPDTTGRFAGLYHNSPEIGVAAVDYLVSLIQRNERGIPHSAHTLHLEASWVDGATAREMSHTASVLQTAHSLEDLECGSLAGRSLIFLKIRNGTGRRRRSDPNGCNGLNAVD